MKKLCLLALLLTILFGVSTYAEINYKVVESTVTINYMNTGDKEYNIIYCNGRMFVPFEQCLEDFDIECKPGNYTYFLTKNDSTVEVSTSTGKSNKTDMYFYNDKAWIYIYKLIEPFGYIPIVNTDSNRIDVYNSVVQNTTYHKTTATNKKLAYIRLEDIMADGMDTSRTPSYNLNMLEELRYTAQYLYESGQSYYVAWIPVYGNPKANYWNDVSQNYNLYNSYFVYTLDYMLDHNGYLVLHGYTHQYGNEISSYGWEFGDDTPFSISEQENRMLKAKACAERLGYNSDCFEFPHYGATAKQIKLAQKHFKLIYQAMPGKTVANGFAWTASSGSKVYFMPTPADYLHNKYDMDNLIARLDTCISKNYAVSLFYHPVIDYASIHEETVENDRIWSYDDTDSSLPTILKYIADKGYIFAPIDMN